MVLLSVVSGALDFQFMQLPGFDFSKVHHQLSVFFLGYYIRKAWLKFIFLHLFNVCWWGGLSHMSGSLFIFCPL